MAIWQHCHRVPSPLTFLSNSGFVKSAAPMPAWTENRFGHPQLRSKPATSCLLLCMQWDISCHIESMGSFFATYTVNAAFKARSGSAVPS